ncbi:Dabb family protein [Sphingomonas sp. BK235]|uniref:Dabb family protein n=1 Tax=Sphingomonas sp. BK235 TaxID=2512131 RepID=UPI001FB73806|nr:Dabb family protein [Sphingomonas sp. BK235]
MESSRRDLMMMMALGGAGAAAATGAEAAAPAIPAKVVHHVFFWLNNAGSAEDRAKLIAGLRTLAGIPALRGLHIGLPAPTEQRDVIDSSWDVSELMFFDTVADQKAYQDHPIHRAFVAECEKLWRKVTVYDVLSA